MMYRSSPAIAWGIAAAWTGVGFSKDRAERALSRRSCRDSSVNTGFPSGNKNNNGDGNGASVSPLAENPGKEMHRYPRFRPQQETGIAMRFTPVTAAIPPAP